MHSCQGQGTESLLLCKLAAGLYFVALLLLSKVSVPKSYTKVIMYREVTDW